MIGVFLAGCEQMPAVVVLDPDGEPVTGAEVYVNGTLACTTDTFGCLIGPFSPGDRLLARHLVYEHPSYRRDHGPGAGWAARFYQTSRMVALDGSVIETVVTDPDLPQVLTLNREEPLIGLNLVASMVWDAPQDEFDTLTTRFRDASQYLYNLTDGQFVIEEVTLADDAQLWNSADIQFDVDNTRRPAAWWAGSLLNAGGGSVQGRITMAPMEADGFASERAPTLIHELGHLAFSLMDEYDGVGVNGDFCTLAQRTSTDPMFAANGPRAACFMDDQTSTSKICTRSFENAHRGGLWQLDPCWPEVAAMFADTASPTGVPRWTVVTPDDLGGIVGTLPPLADNALEPRFNFLNNAATDVCFHFAFSDPAGSGSAGAPVWVLPVTGGQYSLGKMRSNGAIWAWGVHPGDRIYTSQSDTVIAARDCTLVR